MNKAIFPERKSQHAAGCGQRHAPLVRNTSAATGARNIFRPSLTGAACRKHKAAWGWNIHILVAAACLFMAQTGWAWHFTGVVWNDVNQNGIYDTGETGVSNITVQVRKCSNNALMYSTVTAGDGTFTVTDGEVPLDTNYQVFFQIPNGYAFTQQIYPPPTNGVIVSTANPATGFAPCFDFDQLSNNTLNNAGIVPVCGPVESCISSNFNSTAITNGSYLWFNSEVNFSGRNNLPAAILVNNATVNFTANGTPVSLNLPPAIIQFVTNAAAATTAYNSCMESWVTTVPTNYSGNIFLSGLAYQIPTNYPGAISSVTWCADFSGNLAGMAAQWKWGAAVYTNFSANLSALGVKPIDGSTLNQYTNSDPAGTPENFKQFVAKGAGGTGGTNYTGLFPITNTVYLCDSLTNIASLAIKTNTTATALTSLAVCPGNAAMFTTTAAGTGPFSYAWTKNGTTLAGQTTNNLTISPATATNAGTYYVIVTGNCNSVTNSATLTVNGATTATGPTSLTVNPGSSATFSAVAGGTGPFTYVWSKSGTVLAGQTASSITINPVAATNAGVYSVVVSGNCNSVTNSATLTVNTPTTAIFSTANNLTVCPGNSATFAVTASGTGPFTYVWSQNGTILAGQTTNSLTISSVTAASAGAYNVVVTGVVNSVTNSATLAVNGLTMAIGPVSMTNNPGSSVTFTTTAGGTGPFTYAWSKGGTFLAGQTAGSITINPVAATNAGVYSVVVSGACNSVTNNSTLTVNTPTTATFSTATNLAVCPGNSATFAVTAAGTGPFTYVWSQNGAILAGQTTNSLTIAAVTAVSAGTYNVLVTGVVNSATNSAVLTVNSTTTATDPLSLTNNPGSSATFTTVAVGTGPFVYAWSRNGTALPSQTTSSITINPVAATNAGVYSVVVSGACNSVTNNSTLTVNTPTTATLSSLNPPAVCAGSTATFMATASGTGPFTYAWSQNGATLSGQTNSTLIIPSVTATNAGLYAVVVTGAANSVTNSTPLVVNSNTSISALANLVKNPGDNATFSTVAGGTGPFIYAWSFNGSAIAGQTSSSLTVSSVSSNSAGVYSVAVNGDCNGVSSSATLLVNAPTSAELSFSSLALCPGNNGTLTTVASGTGPFSYLWSKNGAVLPGQTNNSLTLPSVAATDAGVYSVVVTGAANSVTNNATVTINLPTTATALAPMVVCPGNSATFSTIASGTGPFSYVWNKDGNVLTGQTNSTLTMASAGPGDAGLYTVTVNGTCNNATSSAALNVNNITTASPLANLVKNPGDNATFSTLAGGTGPFTYQWSQGGSVLAGQTNGNLTISAVSSNNAGVYTVAVIGACNNVTNSATLTVNTPTSATLQTSSLVLCPGNSATLAAVAAGTGPFSYAWSLNGAPLSGQTNSSLIIASAAATNAGLYSVVITGAANSATNNATLTVNTHTTTTALSPVTVCPGNSAAFSAVAAGTGPFSYVWTKNGVLLPTQTNSTLTIASVGQGDAGLYAVAVSGSCNTATSSATLSVNNLTAATGPNNLTENPGDNAVFSTAASGTGPFLYQWNFNGAPMTSQTNSSLTISSVSSNNAGIYNVVVNGACTSVTNSATLTVNAPTSVTIPSANQALCPGNSGTLTAVASGTGPFTYAWSFNGSVVFGQTNSSFTIPVATAADAGVYMVVVTGAANSVTNSATLTVNSFTTATPLISLTNNPGSIAMFSTVAGGTGPFAYVWSFNGSILAGQTNSSLAIPGVSSNSAGAYCVVVNGNCNSATNQATLTVNTLTTAIFSTATNLAVCPGNNATFATVASGTGPFTYAWSKDGVMLAGQTTNSITIPDVAAIDAGTYSVAVTGAANSVTNSGVLTVNVPTTATVPANLIKNPGANASFLTTAGGTGPFAYAWSFKGSVLAAQTNSSLMISSVSSNNAGSYSVVVSGTCNSVTNSATLTVNIPTTAIFATATNLAVCPGNSATFATVASGTGPFTYVWSKNGVALASQTTNSIMIPAVAAADAGTYSVVVSGAANSVTNSGVLAVNVPTTATAPANLTKNPGDTANFLTVAGGTGPFVYAWSFNGSMLDGQTGSGLTISSVSSNSAGVYSVIVSGTCNSVTNSATLTVNTPTTAIFATATNLAICPGGSATFAVAASGTGPFSYVWSKDGTALGGETTNSIMIPSVAATDGGIYSVVVSGVVNSVTNNAVLTVNIPTTVTPPASQIINAGNSATFSTVASGTGPFTYTWFRNGTAIPGQTGSSLFIPIVNSTNTGAYTVQASGACNLATNGATLSLAVPPTVTIISPTNGAVFFALADITILAKVVDVDATVTNVEFFEAGTNQLGGTTSGPPYFILWTNVVPGTYQLTARAMDSLGATAVSAPVTITVLDQPPITAVGPPVFNPQIDVVEQTYQVVNQTYYSYDGVRVVISNLVNGVTVYNATGTTNGLPYVQAITPVPPGGSVQFTIEYYNPARVLPTNVVYMVELVGALNTPNQTGALVPLTRGTFLPARTFLIEFNTQSNRVYSVQYSSNLTDWETSVPAITGIGASLDWIDNGPPATASPPATQAKRFYRVIQLP